MSKQGQTFAPFDSLRRENPPGLEQHIADFLKRGGVIKQIPAGVGTMSYEGGLKEASERNANVVLGGKRKPTKAQQMKITSRDEE